jgi:hypothetical protein
MNVKKLCCVLSVLCILGIGKIAHADWTFGIGTGISGMSFQGDLGFNSKLAGGPVKVDVDLTPSDVSDYMDSAFGLGGFATNGKVVFEGSFSYLSLNGSSERRFQNTTLHSELDFDFTKADLTVGYNMVKNENFVLRPYIGARYNKHEVEVENVLYGIAEKNRKMDEDWTDALIGIVMDVPFAGAYTWSTKFDYGFGGSDGSYLVNSGVNLNITKHWFMGVYGQYYAIKYENGHRGDVDWYLYDVDESSAGVKVGFKW